jgi:RND family efflux transporter MFP subunit
MIRNLTLLAALAALAACSRGPAPDTAKAAAKTEAAPIAVRTENAAARTLDRTIAVTGTLLPDETVTVSAEVPGRILRIAADFGQYVRRGDVLIELDATEYNLQVERATASLNQALARLGLPPYNGKLVPPDTTPGVRQALAQLEDFKFKFESASKLVKTGDIAQDRFIEIEKAYRARQAVVDAARDELRTQWMSVAALEADLKIIEKRRNDTRVRAPFDGVVGEKLISAGQYVKDNVGIVKLVKVSPLRLRVEVPEAAANLVKPGSSLRFNTDAAPGAEFAATVREINPALDSRSRTLTVEARLTQSDTRLRPGMFVQVQLVSERNAEIVTVPRRAVYSVAGLTKVFKIENGAARQVVFVPGAEIEGGVEVPGGLLKPGDAVAVTELGSLTDGAKVRQ